MQLLEPSEQLTQHADNNTAPEHEHVELVRLRYGKAETRSDTHKEVRRLGSREVVAFRKRGSQRGKEENLASKVIYNIAFQVPRFASVT